MVIWGVGWITTDAKPQIIGTVGRENRTYIRVSPEDTMAFWLVHDGGQAGIADKELMALVIGSLDGYADRSNAVLFVRVGNMDAVCWAIKGKGRSKFARMILSTYLLWFVKHGEDVVTFYLRTNQNVTADEVERLADGGLAAWGTNKRLTRIDGPDQRWAFCLSAPHFGMGSDSRSEAAPGT